MGILEFEKKILKYSGIERYPSKRMKYVFYLLKFWNFLYYFTAIFTSTFYIISTKDIIKIVESMSTSSTALIMFIWYVVFCMKADEIFEFMDDVEELNEKCKKIKN